MIRKVARTAKRTETDLARVFASYQDGLERAIESVARNPTSGAVHRTRVAARRLRALLKALGDRERRIEIRRYRRDLRALALELGAVREADVLREEMLETLARLSNGNVAARRKISALLDQECALARRHLLEHIHSLAWKERDERLQRSFATVHSLLGQIRDQQGIARSMIVNSAQAFWRARRRGNGSARDLHKIRIHAKSHRYVVDALAPIVGIEAGEFGATARAIQQGIGRHLDARLARKWLSTHTEPVSKSLAKDALARLRKDGRKGLKEAKHGLRSLSG